MPSPPVAPRRGVSTGLVVQADRLRRHLPAVHGSHTRLGRFKDITTAAPPRFDAVSTAGTAASSFGCSTTHHRTYPDRRVDEHRIRGARTGVRRRAHRAHECDDGAVPRYRGLHQAMADLEALRELVDQSEHETFPLGRIPPKRPQTLSDGQIGRDAVRREPDMEAELRAGQQGRRAEGVGFEPTSGVTRSGFQDRRHRPLGEPSRRTQRRPGPGTSLPDGVARPAPDNRAVRVPTMELVHSGKVRDVYADGDELIWSRRIGYRCTTWCCPQRSRTRGPC